MDNNIIRKSSEHHCELLDYIDINTLKSILEAFTNCTDLMANIVDINGKSLFSRKDISKCTRFCKTIYSYEGGIERCQGAYCRAGKQAAKFKQPYIFRCPAGLMEWAAPVMVGDRHIATIICGQVLIWEPEDFFWLEIREMNSTLTSNFTELFSAARELPVISGEKVRSALEILYIIANYLVNNNNVNVSLSSNSKEIDVVKNPSYSKITEDAINFLSDNISKKITISDLVEELGISAGHLSKVFKNDTNTSVMEYLSNMRIERACELLKKAQYRINEVSVAVGYDDQNYFSRAFKAKMNMSPSEYRKKNFLEE